MSNAQSKRNHYLTAAIELAGVGFEQLTLANLSRKCGCSRQGIAYHFGNNSAGLRVAVINRAIETGNSRIIAQLIAINDPAVNGLSADERARHLISMS